MSTTFFELIEELCKQLSLNYWGTMHTTFFELIEELYRQISLSLLKNYIHNFLENRDV